jgi:hypothetical protein
MPEREVVEMTHFNTGRKQTPEHIAKRVEAIRIAKGLWSADRYEQYRKAVSASAKGRSAWNKGISLSDETKRKLSESHKGIQSGEKHPMFGKHHTDDSKLKISLAHRGRKQTEEVIKKRVEAMSWYRHTEETKAKIGAANAGENNAMFGKYGELNPTWRGGLSFEPYPNTWTFALREMIRNRDGRKCCICGIGETVKRHDVHHIDYDKKNTNPHNLITLCVPCHRKTNYKREYWTAVLSNHLALNQRIAVNE